MRPLLSLPHRPLHNTFLRAVLMLLVALLLVQGAAGSGLASAQAAPDDGGYVEGKVVVRYRELTGPMAQVAPELAGYAVLDVPPGLTEDEFIAQLQQDPAIESAERDVLVRAALAPDDRNYVSAQRPYMQSMSAEAGWDVHTGDNDVIIAVIDTGIDTLHPEFAGQLWVNPNEIPGNGIDDDSNGCVDDINGCRFVDASAQNAIACGYRNPGYTGAISDDHGIPGVSAQHSHGTMVAGMAGARGDNGIGVTGAAWHAKIMPIKVLDCGATAGCPCGSMLNVAQAILYASRNGADVINLSLSSDAAVDDTQALRDAITAAGANGTIIVAATGNDGASEVGFPAAYAGRPGFDHVVAVGSASVQPTITRAYFSNAGPSVTVAAPGVDIAGPVRVAMQGAFAPYGTNSGTSFSAPLVSGLFALLRSRNPELGPGEAVAIVRETATPVGDNSGNWAGSGLVNYGRALNRVPMTLTGSALDDFADLPTGTAIIATVGDVFCGSSMVTTGGTINVYHLRVASDAERPGCGAPGRVVQFITGDHRAREALLWSEPNTSLAYNIDLTDVTQGPGTTMSIDLTTGWNSIGQAPGGGIPRQALQYLGDAWSMAYAWRPNAPTGYGDNGAYLRAIRTGPVFATTWQKMQQFDAFWVYATADRSIEVATPATPERTVTLSAGWNQIYYTGPVRRVADIVAPLGDSYRLTARYDNTAKRYSAHLRGVPRNANDFEAMLPFTAYWIYVTEPGTITIPGYTP